ncbi:hypothetical protein WJX75_009727 [Coccomyxa subellipsoidea]|uniref:Hexosyltransferase n=1 Tax=Coccomyxa subellipsoidea TaxID=248742 RepID=A0ABR2Z4N4_9CHLO
MSQQRVLDRQGSHSRDYNGHPDAVRTASLVANALLCLLLFYESANIWIPTRKVLRHATASVDNTEAFLSRLHQGVHIAQVQLKAATSNLNRGKHVANSLESSIGQYQESLKTLEATGHPEKAWLTVGIPTVPRKNEADYLTRTLESLLEELPLDSTDPMYANVRIVVMNNQKGNHSVFYKVRQRLFEGQPKDHFMAKARVYVEMFENPGTLPDPAPDTEEPNDLNNPTNRPGRQVRKQTCDLITLLETSLPMSHYYLFMEDDFRLCPNGVRIIHYLVAKLNAAPETRQWLSVRLSYGMNGILLPNAHLSSLSQYLRLHTARLPSDLLYIEWLQGKRVDTNDSTSGKIQYVYQKNIMDHLGTLSSFAIRPERLPFPGCFNSMSDVWSLSRSMSVK